MQAILNTGTAGLHMVPMAVAMALGAVVSSRTLARWGRRLPMMGAGAALAAVSASVLGCRRLL